MNDLKKSSSSKIKEFLEHQSSPEGGFKEFTSAELAAMTGASFGAASGFMHRLWKSGIASKVGRKEGQVVWSVDAELLSTVHVKKSASAGSRKGDPKRGRGSSAHLPNISDKKDFYDPITALMECASYLETHRTSLSLYTTEELVDELHRRYHRVEPE